MSPRVRGLFCRQYRVNASASSLSHCLTAVARVRRRQLQRRRRVVARRELMGSAGGEVDARRQYRCRHRCQRRCRRLCCRHRRPPPLPQSAGVPPPHFQAALAATRRASGSTTACVRPSSSSTSRVPRRAVRVERDALSYARHLAKQVPHHRHRAATERKVNGAADQEDALSARDDRVLGGTACNRARARRAARASQQHSGEEGA